MKRRLPGRRTPALLAALAAAGAAAGLLTACGARADGPRGERHSAAERVLLASLGSSNGVRYTHLRCVTAPEAQWTDFCTFQAVWPREGQDQPLVVLAMRFEEDRPLTSSGTVPLDVTCAQNVRCWVRTLCFATRDCPGFAPGDETALALPVRTPTPTLSRCVSAWNAHGGFSPAEVAQPEPVLPTMAVARPVYTTHLSGASFGFLGPRADVRPTADGCAVLFDLGGEAYEVSAKAWGEPRFWMWRGADDLARRGSSQASWNACQRDDGTLFVSTSCPAVAAVPRAVREELERGSLQELSNAGGIPYWLGRTFAGARPLPIERRGAESAVAYMVRTDGHRITLRVLTYRPPDRSRTTNGVLVARAEPEDATVLVVADRQVSADLRRAALAALRPFVASEPDAEQVPGDLEEEPTRIDVSAPVALYWAGASFEGFTADVVDDAPAGAGIVRYADGRAQWFIVSYTPRKKKHCSRLGCVSPPPLPAALRPYGRVVETILLDQLVVVVLAERPRNVPNGALIYEHLERLR
jgi:hypothetical protein